MLRSLQDTDTYSEILKGKNTLINAIGHSYLLEHGRFTLSSLTIFEIVWGLQRMERSEQIVKLLNELPNVELIDLNTEIAALAGHIFGDLYRIGQQIGSIDSLIAATAIHYELTLISGNTRHFERIQLIGYPLLLSNWK